MPPDTIPLTDEQFKIFLEKTVTTEHSRRILDGLTAQNTATAAMQTVEIARDNGAGREQDEQSGTRISG